jgi:hypothetical protein
MFITRAYTQAAPTVNRKRMYADQMAPPFAAARLNSYLKCRGYQSLVPTSNRKLLRFVTKASKGIRADRTMQFFVHYNPFNAKNESHWDFWSTTVALHRAAHSLLPYAFAGLSNLESVSLHSNSVASGYLRNADIELEMAVPNLQFEIRIPQCSCFSFC